MWLAISFLFVVVVPVCAAATLVNRWLRSMCVSEDGFESAAAIRHAASDMSERLKNLELMLANEGLRHDAVDQA